MAKEMIKSLSHIMISSIKICITAIVTTPKTQNTKSHTRRISLPITILLIRKCNKMSLSCANKENHIETSSIIKCKWLIPSNTVNMVINMTLSCLISTNIK